MYMNKLSWAGVQVHNCVQQYVHTFCTPGGNGNRNRPFSITSYKSGFFFILDQWSSGYYIYFWFGRPGFDSRHLQNFFFLFFALYVDFFCKKLQKMADFYFRFLPVYKKCEHTTTHSHGPRCQPKRVFSCTLKSKLKMDSDQGWCLNLVIHHSDLKKLANGLREAG